MILAIFVRVKVSIGVDLEHVARMTFLSAFPVTSLLWKFLDCYKKTVFCCMQVKVLIWALYCFCSDCCSTFSLNSDEGLIFYLYGILTLTDQWV